MPLVLDPDYKQLADLLRSKRPIPEGARDMLAEMLDPSEGNPIGIRLEAIETSTINQSLRLVGEVKRTSDLYDIEYKKCKSSQEAAERVAENISCSDRTVYNRVSRWKRALGWFRAPK